MPLADSVRPTAVFDFTADSLDGQQVHQRVAVFGATDVLFDTNEIVERDDLQRDIANLHGLGILQQVVIAAKWLDVPEEVEFAGDGVKREVGSQGK